MRKYLLIGLSFTVFLVSGCASVPHPLVQKVMEPEERAAAYKEAKDSRLFWQCTAAGIGVIAAVSSEGSTESKTGAALIIPLVTVPVTSLINFATYDKNDPEIEAMINGTIYGAIGGAVLGGLTYLSIATGPVADRKNNELSSVVVFMAEAAVLGSSFGFLWNQAAQIFGWDNKKEKQ